CTHTAARQRASRRPTPSSTCAWLAPRPCAPLEDLPPRPWGCPMGLGGCPRRSRSRLARRRRSRYRVCIGDDDNAARRLLGVAGAAEGPSDTPSVTCLPW